jgi:hypothetical protein
MKADCKLFVNDSALFQVRADTLPKKIKKIPAQGSNELFVLYKALLFKRNDFGIPLERIQQIKIAYMKTIIDFLLQALTPKPVLRKGYCIVETPRMPRMPLKQTTKVK